MSFVRGCLKYVFERYGCLKDVFCTSWISFVCYVDVEQISRILWKYGCLKNVFVLKNVFCMYVIS